MRVGSTQTKEKDREGLLKYIIPILLVALMPILWFSFCMYFNVYDYFKDLVKYSDTVDSFSALILFLLLIFYFAFPIVYTIAAIKNHWSKTLDKFFNQFKAPTIWFVIAIIIVLAVEFSNFFVGHESNKLKLFFYNLYVSVIPCYCIIYLVILANNIYKKKFKKI